MNKYTELSDFEINKKVADEIGIDYTTDNAGNLIVYKHLTPIIFNPCNNHDDAIPIIINNKISGTPASNDLWACIHYPFEAINKNPLRAAMEVFLMMKDFTENEND